LALHEPHEQVRIHSCGQRHLKNTAAMMLVFMLVIRPVNGAVWCNAASDHFPLCITALLQNLVKRVGAKPLQASVVVLCNAYAERLFFTRHCLK
jgi:hypothetical protein